MTALAPTLQAFFTDRLIRQRHAGSHTITAYRDTWRLLLGYAATTIGSAPSRLDLVDLDASLIAGFLDHLEHDRGAITETLEPVSRSCTAAATRSSLITAGH